MSKSRSSRRGRKRKLVPRHPGGRPVRERRQDGGTAESRMKRLALVGKADPALAESPLGILRARGAISQDQYDAGHLFAFLRWSGIGRSTPHAARIARLVPEQVSDAAEPPSLSDEPPDERHARHRRRFLSLDQALAGYSATAHREVRRIAIDRVLPPWLERYLVVQLYIANRRAAGEGLTAEDRALLSAATAAFETAARPVRAGLTFLAVEMGYLPPAALEEDAETAR